jgi:hypothetical protein
MGRGKEYFWSWAGCPEEVLSGVHVANKLNQMEHLLNVYIGKAAKHSVAELLGYCNANAEEMFLGWGAHEMNQIGHLLNVEVSKRQSTTNVIGEEVLWGAQGAHEMNQMEHLLNVYVAKAAKNSVAEFLGYCNVTAEESNRSLTEGLWLVSL